MVQGCFYYNDLESNEINNVDLNKIEIGDKLLNIIERDDNRIPEMVKYIQ